MAAVALELGNCEAHEGHVAEAAKSFDRIIREMPGSPYVGAAYYNLAKLYSARQDYVRAPRPIFMHWITRADMNSRYERKYGLANFFSRKKTRPAPSRNCDAPIS